MINAAAPSFGSARTTVPLSARNDVLVFQTELLDKDVEVTGPLSVSGFWTSDFRVNFSRCGVESCPPWVFGTSGFPAHLIFLRSLSS